MYPLQNSNSSTSTLFQVSESIHRFVDGYVLSLERDHDEAGR